jgi:hypothetical protein
VNATVPVTHATFGAVYEQPGGLVDSWASEDMIARNDGMFRSFLDAVRTRANLTQLSLSGTFLSGCM